MSNYLYGYPWSAVTTHPYRPLLPACPQGPADHRIKLKECEKRDKYLDLARELKKLWNRKVTIIPIVIGTFGTVTKGLLKGLEIWKLATEWRPSKQEHYWKLPEYWEESWRLEETCCHSISSDIHSSYSDVKTLWSK